MFSIDKPAITLLCAFPRAEIAQRSVLGAMAGAILPIKEPPDIARYRVLEGQDAWRSSRSKGRLGGLHPAFIYAD